MLSNILLRKNFGARTYGASTHLLRRIFTSVFNVLASEKESKEEDIFRPLVDFKPKELAKLLGGTGRAAAVWKYLRLSIFFI
jgi:hypothetical protein